MFTFTIWPRQNLLLFLRVRLFGGTFTCFILFILFTLFIFYCLREVGSDPPGRCFTGGVWGRSPGLVKRGRAAVGAPCDQWFSLTWSIRGPPILAPRMRIVSSSSFFDGSQNPRDQWFPLTCSIQGPLAAAPLGSQHGDLIREFAFRPPPEAL